MNPRVTLVRWLLCCWWSCLTGALRNNATTTDTTLHFAIVLGTSPRDNDRHYLVPRYTAIDSVMKQTYPHWTMIFVGDCLNANATKRFLTTVKESRLPPERFIFHNLALNETSRYIYSRKRLMRCYSAPAHKSAWCHYGTTPLNKGIDIAYSMPHVTHVAILGDDDFYFPGHLENVVGAYRRYPSAGFTFSRGLVDGHLMPGDFYPHSKRPRHQFHVNTSTPFRPELSNTIAALITFQLSDDPDIQTLMRFYLDYEQGTHSKRGRVLANDGDLLLRIGEYIDSSGNTNFSVFIPYVSGMALAGKAKGLCVGRMNDDYEKNVTTDVETCHIPKLNEYLHRNILPQFK